jgi:hypothetical protein
LLLEAAVADFAQAVEEYGTGRRAHAGLNKGEARRIKAFQFPKRVLEMLFSVEYHFNEF